MKLGVKEMKKEYKKVDIGKIEASLLQNPVVLRHSTTYFPVLSLPVLLPFLLPLPLLLFCRMFKMNWRTCWSWQVKCRTSSGAPTVYQKMWMRMT